MYSTFLQRYLYLPFVVFLLAILLVAVLGLDHLLADWLFALEGHAWTLRENWFTASLIHEGGRHLVALVLICLLGAIGLSYTLSNMAAWRRPLLYLLASATASALMVNILKVLTHRDCPWDLMRYGGLKPETSLFQAMPGGMEMGACFPAGHASAAWCWIGMWFVARHVGFIRHWAILAVIILAGLTFGFAQQLRGAHFMSHDLWTIMISWSIAVSLVPVFALQPKPGLGNRQAH